MTHIGYQSRSVFSVRERVLLWLIGIILCLAAGVVSVFMDLSKAEREFTKQASLIQEVLSRRIGSLEVVLTALVGLHQASDEVADVQFSTFSEELLGPYPYIRSVLSLRRVSASERPLLEQIKQDSGYFQFQISELAEQGKLRPAGDRPQYLAIDQIEPLTPKISQLLGYDALSNPELSAAIDAAVRTGQVTASMPTLLLRGSKGLLVFKARYQGRYPPNTEGERQTMLDGAIAVALDTDAILKGIIPIPTRADIFLRYPGSGSIDQVSRHSMNVEKKDTASVPAYLPVFSYRRVLNIYGQSAVLEILQQAGMENITAGWLLMAMLSPLVVMLAMTWAWRNQRIRQDQEQELEETIRDDERRFKYVVETAFDAVVMTDQNRKIITWNRRAEQMFGWHSKEMIGMPMPPGLLPTENYLDKLTDRSESDEEMLINDHIETIARHRDGTTFPVEMAISVAAHGKCYQQSAFIRDIRARKAQEEKLQQAKEAAEAGSRAKSEFLAVMSHEIRTPMNGVLGMTELLLDSGLTGSQRRHAETAHRSGQILLDVINNILDFSKIEANMLRIAQSLFDLQEVVEDVLQMVAEQAREKRLELFSDIPTGIHGKVIGDGPRLRQVLINLVGNAVKFTEKGEIVVRINPLEETGDEILILFEVQDSGIGISADKLASVFDVFTQEDGSVTRQFGGTGLGLTISRKLVALMGGELGVESKKYHGSRFHFTVRFEKQAGGREAVTASLDQFVGTKVLVVDDNMPIRSLLLRKINEWDMQATGADCGDRALQLLQEAATTGKPYALAILDRMMPGMDGISLARKIKADPKTADIKLLMYSALHEEADGASWREAGIQAYLSKPARLTELRDRLLSLLADNSSKNEEVEVLPAEPAETTQSGWRILLVEDNLVNQEVAKMMLEQLGCRTDVADNGKIAVESVKQKYYDLILMDCHMPEMDGFAATTAIRNQESDGIHVPIIALTADVQKGVQEQCSIAGMDDYLSKPFSQNALQAVMKIWLPEKDKEIDFV